MKIDNPTFSPDVARAGRRDIALRDIRGWLEHRATITPDTDRKTHNKNTMVGALRIALRGYAEADEKLSQFSDSISSFDPTGKRIEVYESPTQPGTTVALEYGKFGFTSEDEYVMRKEKEEEEFQRNSRFHSVRIYHGPSEIKEYDYDAIEGDVIPVVGSEDKFAIAIGDKTFEMPSPHDSEFGIELMQAISEVEPKLHLRTVYKRNDGEYR